ncbi:MAG: hypothetical protein KAS75_00765 [Planctomycetes bacterium]|nr:hypothetical protein [Planctomycetota bacterium]
MQSQKDAEGLEGPPDRLFSPSVGLRFYETAYELSKTGQFSSAKAKQALAFLNSTLKLDSRAKYVLPDMIKVASSYFEQDNSKMVRALLTEYMLDPSADLELARKAVGYQLEQLNSREEREQLLEELLKDLGDRNAGLSSELATLLGLLKSERADTEFAPSLFIRAYNDNKYNRLAFEKLLEIMPEQIDPATYMEHLRLVLGENPLDIEAALVLARYAESLQLYDTASDAYRYCANLFKFLYPSHALPDSIYLPWMISNYNTQRNPSRCLQIISELRTDDFFDLRAEAIAGKATAKIGDKERADQTLKAAEEKALQLLEHNSSSGKVTAKQLAWFYCFVKPDKDKALSWSNKAYSVDSNSITSAAILAYSFTMNEQIAEANSIINNYEHTQISDLALARIQVAEEQKDLAIVTLKSAIDKEPGSLAAEWAKETLVKLDSQYIPPIDKDLVLTSLRSSFGWAIVPPFANNGKLITVEFSVRGSKFSYDSKFGGSLSITNNSPEPLVISDDGLFTGYIRIDANVSGDINRNIPNLVSTRIRPTLPVKPGQSVFVPIQLVTGEFKQILLTYPQASLDIEFTVYIDPVATEDGTVVNRLQTVEPTKISVKRPGVELTRKYLQNRLNSLAKGRQGQKIQTAHLFVGLLMEQNAMANREPMYKFTYADWMPVMLKSALLQHLTNDDWVAKTHTMASMLYLPLDYDLIDAVSESLDDTNWPARMMAIFLLSKNQGDNFKTVLDYTAKYDSSKFVRDMAIALGGSDGQAEKPEGSQPTETQSALSPGS